MGYEKLNLFIDPTRKCMKEGVIPTLNLPTKSLTSVSQHTRSTTSIVKREAVAAKIKEECKTITRSCFKNFNDFLTRVHSLVLPGW